MPQEAEMLETRPTRAADHAIRRAHEARGRVLRDIWDWMFGPSGR